MLSARSAKHFPLFTRLYEEWACLLTNDYESLLILADDSGNTLKGVKAVAGLGPFNMTAYLLHNAT